MLQLLKGLRMALDLKDHARVKYLHRSIHTNVHPIVPEFIGVVPNVPPPTEKCNAHSAAQGNPQNVIEILGKEAARKLVGVVRSRPNILQAVFTCTARQHHMSLAHPTCTCTEHIHTLSKYGNLCDCDGHVALVAIRIHNWWPWDPLPILGTK